MTGSHPTGPAAAGSANGRRPPLKPTEERCLRLVGLHEYVSAEQIRRGLGFCEGCGSYARELAASLTRFGLLERVTRDRAGPRGSMASAYTLTTAGRRALAQLGVEASGRYRPVEERRRSRIFLSHTLVCVDVAISATLLGEQTPNVGLRRLWHERSLRRQPTYVETDGRRSAVIPDLRLDLAAGGDQVMVSCEVDLSSERGSAWKRKVRHLAAWADGPYQDAYKTDSLTIAVIAPGDERRAHALCHYTEGALDEIGARRLSNLFVFTAQDPATASPQTFWLAPGCWQPFAEQPVPLIEGWAP